MQQQAYSKVYRIMHWAIAFCMLGLLLTIFLRLTWLNKFEVATIIENYLADNSLSLSEDERITLAKKIRKPMWQWHIYLGYALTALYSIRLALPFFGEMSFTNPFKKELTKEEKFKYVTYALFYVFVAISLITGLIIEHGPKEYKHTMEEIHELSIYYLVAFIVIHFAGVLRAEFTHDKGIISRVISGLK